MGEKLPSEILDAAADLITPEGAWSPEWVARRADGSWTFASDPEAASWNMGGAVIRAEDCLAHTEAWNFLRATLDTLEPAIWEAAPTRTQSEVVQALRTAAAKAREASQ